jgi:membrane protease YdiL (CAAX protease family)
MDSFSAVLLSLTFVLAGVGLVVTVPWNGAIIVLQVLLFGLWHYRGFPGGLIGVILVFVWGIFLGIIRLRTSGMLFPFLAHFYADVTIFGILYMLL